MDDIQDSPLHNDYGLLLLNLTHERYATLDTSFP